MRAFIFYIYLVFFLQLCGSNLIFAAGNHNVKSFSFKQRVEIKHKVKRKESNHYHLVIESNEVDLDEEFHSVDDCHDSDSTNLSCPEGSSNSVYFSFLDQNIFNIRSPKNKLYQLLLVDSTPIYLKIAVLRI